MRARRAASVIMSTMPLLVGRSEVLALLRGVVVARRATTARRRRTACRRCRRAASRAHRWSSRPRSRTGTARGGRGRSWRSRARGCDGSKRAASFSPTTSSESDSSAMRSAMRRLVLARRLSRMTPAGRCVAMIRWMPSERPRWAMSTTPSTNSGTSPTSAANSSMIEHERRRGVGVAALLELEQVLRALAVQELLAVVQLGAQARQRAPHEVRGEVGDEADGVRELDAVGERRAALVVDEQERDAVGAVLGGHAEHPRLQELALARAGRAADERVRSLRAQVEVHDAVRALADRGAQAPGPAPGRGGRAGCGR